MVFGEPYLLWAFLYSLSHLPFLFSVLTEMLFFSPIPCFCAHTSSNLDERNCWNQQVLCVFGGYEFYLLVWNGREKLSILSFETKADGATSIFERQNLSPPSLPRQECMYWPPGPHRSRCRGDIVVYQSSWWQRRRIFWWHFEPMTLAWNQSPCQKSFMAAQNTQHSLLACRQWQLIRELLQAPANSKGIRKPLSMDFGCIFHQQNQRCFVSGRIHLYFCNLGLRHHVGILVTLPRTNNACM